MTRYTRAKGSKACNDRKEEATPWHVMRQQLFNQSVDNHVQENTIVSRNIRNDVRKKEVWSEIEIEGIKRQSCDSSLKRNIQNKKDNVFESKLKIKSGRKNKVTQSNLDDTQSKLMHNNILFGKESLNLGNKAGKIIVQNISNEESKTHNYEKVNTVKETKRSEKKQNLSERKTISGDNNCFKQSCSHDYGHSKVIKSSQIPRLEQQEAFIQKKSLNFKNNVKNQQLQTIIHGNSKNKVNKISKWNNNESCTINANGREIKVVRFEGFWIKKDDALELKTLRKGLRSNNIPKNEIKNIIKLERRKAEKSLAREKNNVCFQCRKFGHNFSECPDIKDTQLSKSGMCFKCGSMEHSFFECKVLQNQEFRFAVCFVCQDQGHIARQCPLNSQGQYPKGGSCHLCGEVTHLRKDCPKAISEKIRKSNTVEQMKNDDLEDLSEVTTQFKKPEISKIKVVQF